MTRRENFLNTLKHKEHERMPALVVIDNFNYPQTLPAVFDMKRITSFEDPEGMIELSRFYGLDTLLRMVPSIVKSEWDPGVKVSIESRENGKTVTVWETTEGKIKSISGPSLEANSTFILENPIKDINDYKIFLSFIKSQKYSIDEKNIKESKRILELIGDEGIAYTVAPSTPIMDLARTWVGLENFIYHMCDNPGLVDSVLEAMAENCYQQYEIIAKNSPCEVIVFWDDANSLYLSPRMFEKYSVPVMKRFSEIAHKYGKTIVCHTCGNISSFLNLFLKTEVDAVDWVAPTPIGDVEPRIAQDIWGDKITMMLSVVPDVFKNGTQEQVKEHINTLLRGLNLKKNLVFMIVPPIGTPMENVQCAIKTLIDTHGVPLNESSRFGNILDNY